MDTRQVGEQLVELCRQGRNMDAIDRLYSDEVVSVEAQASPNYRTEARGIKQVKEKNQTWFDNNELHAASVEGPFPHNDRFAVKYHFDMTPKVGPMAGQRFQMDEIAVYTVRDGKVVHEEFFYGM